MLQGHMVQVGPMGFFSEWLLSGSDIAIHFKNYQDRELI